MTSLGSARKMVKSPTASTRIDHCKSFSSSSSLTSLSLLKHATLNIHEQEVEQLRSKLDSSYHEQYSRQRKFLQLHILQQLLHTNGDPSTTNNTLDSVPFTNVSTNGKKSRCPIVVCLAGPMAVGKSYLVQWMSQRKYLPFMRGAYDEDDNPVIVNMDVIRELLPESAFYKTECPDKYGELTQRESGAIAELLVHLSLRRGRNVIIDGSMLQLEWQKNYLTQLKNEYVNMKLLLLHVTASSDVIRTRAIRRFDCSGRFVPPQVLEESIQQLTKFSQFKEFCAIADLTLSIDNTELCRPFITFPVDLAWNMLPDMYEIFLYSDNELDCDYMEGESQHIQALHTLSKELKTSNLPLSHGKSYHEVDNTMKLNTFPLKAKDLKHIQRKRTNVFASGEEVSSSYDSNGCLSYTSCTTIDLSHRPNTDKNTLYSSCCSYSDNESSKSKSYGKKEATFNAYSTMNEDDSWDEDDESAITVVKGFLKAINEDIRLSRSFEGSATVSTNGKTSSDPNMSNLHQRLPPLPCSHYDVKSKQHSLRHSTYPCKVCRLDKIIRPSCPFAEVPPSVEQTAAN